MDEVPDGLEKERRLSRTPDPGKDDDLIGPEVPLDLREVGMPGFSRLEILPRPPWIQGCEKFKKGCHERMYGYTLV